MRMFLPTSSSNSVIQLPLLDLRTLTVSGLHAQQNVFAFEVLLHLAQLDVNLVADGGGALDHAGGLADGAGYRESALQRLLDALAGDGDEAEIVELENLGGGAVALESFFEGGQDLEAVLAVVHVDEVDDDDAAEVAKANLANDLRHRIEVGLDDCVFKARRFADVFAGVDVDGDQGFSLVDDDGAARS